MVSIVPSSSTVMEIGEARVGASLTGVIVMVAVAISDSNLSVELSVALKVKVSDVVSEPE